MNQALDQQQHLCTDRSPQATVVQEKLPPPNRLIGPMTIGVIVEVLTLITLMVTLASRQFSIFSFILGLLGILTPLLLALRSFWLLSRDEARTQRIMQAWERAPASPAFREQETPLEACAPSARRELAQVP